MLNTESSTSIMAIGKNKKLGKKVKAGGKKKAIDPFTRKVGCLTLASGTAQLHVSPSALLGRADNQSSNSSVI